MVSAEGETQPMPEETIESNLSRCGDATDAEAEMPTDVEDTQLEEEHEMPQDRIHEDLLQADGKETPQERKQKQAK